MIQRAKERIRTPIMSHRPEGPKFLAKCRSTVHTRLFLALIVPDVSSFADIGRKNIAFTGHIKQALHESNTAACTGEHDIKRQSFKKRVAPHQLQPRRLHNYR